jgi:hypothetical protein
MPTSSKEEEVNLNGSVLIESLTASTTPPPRFLSLSRLEILYPLGNSSWLETELSSQDSCPTVLARKMATMGQLFY